MNDILSAIAATQFVGAVKGPWTVIGGLRDRPYILRGIRNRPFFIGGMRDGKFQRDAGLVVFLQRDA